MKQINVTVRLKPIDWITLAFCLWMVLLITFGWHRVQHPLSHFISYLSIMAGVMLLIWVTAFFKEFAKPEYCPTDVCKVMRPKVYRIIYFIRSYYPVLLFGYFFESASSTNRVFFNEWLDPFFQRIDLAIFGYLPSLEWGLRYNNLWLREWLYFCYFSYYLMILGIPILFYVKRRKAFDEVIFVLSLVFYFCYFIYSWLPVIGGRYIPLAMELTKQSGGGVFSSIMAYIYTHSQHMGGAFPSSHLAIALVLSLLTLKYFKALGYVMLFITFFLSIATVYCHYHWFIDTVFGTITGILGYWIAQKVFHRFSEVQGA